MNKNNIKSIDIQYIGDVYYYLNLLKSEYIIFNHSLLHFKGLNLNRTTIMGANKLLVLSVPLDGGRSVKARLKDLKIAGRQAWQRIHWRSIHDSYRKAPWFEEYAPELEILYKQEYTYLWDLNLKLTSWVFKALQWDTVILAESEIENSQKIEKVNNFNFLKMGQGYPIYHQVFSDKLGFQPNLSILDLLMNEGPLASDYLQKLAAYHLNNTGE
jgi:hypothetical protein